MGLLFPVRGESKLLIACIVEDGEEKRKKEAEAGGERTGTDL